MMIVVVANLLWMGTIRKTVNSPIMPAHLVSCHKMYVATIVMSGDVQSGCNTSDTISNRFTSFDNKLASFPGAVSLKALCDNWSDWNT